MSAPSDAGRALARGRWSNTTAEERKRATKAATAASAAARSKAALDRRIAELVDKAPALTDDQRAKLRQLVNAPTSSAPSPAVVAASTDPSTAVAESAAAVAQMLTAAGGTPAGMTADQSAALVDGLSSGDPATIAETLRDLGAAFAEKLRTVA